MEAQNLKNNALSQALHSTKGQHAGEHAPPAAPPVTSGSIVAATPGGSAFAGTGIPCSGFLLREVLSGTTGPLRL